MVLQADSLDMLGDALVYGFNFYAIGRNEQWRAGSALFTGSIVVVFGFAVLLQSGYKLALGDIPASDLMWFLSVIALVANGGCLLLLSRHKADDVNMRSTWLRSRNDIISNTSVLFAATLVALTQSVWPDVVMGLLITSIFLKSAVYVLRQAWTELRQPVAQSSTLAMAKLAPMQQLCVAGTCAANACRCGGL